MSTCVERINRSGDRPRLPSLPSLRSLHSHHNKAARCPVRTKKNIANQTKPAVCVFVCLFVCLFFTRCSSCNLCARARPRAYPCKGGWYGDRKQTTTNSTTKTRPKKAQYNYITTYRRYATAVTGHTAVLCRRGSVLHGSRKVDVELARGTRRQKQEGGGGLSDDRYLLPARTTEHSILNNTAAIVQ